MKHLIAYCEEKNYENASFNSSKLQTINLENQLNDQFNKGYIISEFDLKKTPLNINHFLGLPGLFDMKMGNTAFTDAYKKRKRLSIPVEVHVIKTFNFPKREDEAVLILGAKYSDIDRENPKTRKREKWKGVTFYYLDTSLFIQEDDVTTIQGTPIVTASMQNKTLNIFPKLPAYYTLETGTSRSNKGGELEEIIGVKQVGDFDLKTLIGGEPPKQ
jgi:hypothetical protein